MMFFASKSKKIRKYLDEKTATGTTTVFDELLHDYLSGELKTELTALELKKVEIHIDWLEDYRCVGVQAVHHNNYLDLQIEPTTFSIGYDPDEPDEHDSYPLESKEQLYIVLKQILKT